MQVAAKRRSGTAAQRVLQQASLLCRCAAMPLLISACAKMGPPPGGPTDLQPPVLVSTRPESTSIYPGFDGDAEFVFDETVSEGGSANMGFGSGDLERLIIVSPTEEVPKVRWARSRITVRPREGWRPNTVYRIELLPGVTDLRRNRERTGQVITFSTGAPLPTDTLTGILLDWTTRQPARLAGIEAVLLPDSLVYRTSSDSTGRFQLGPLPHGSYLVRAFIDANKDRRLNGREIWDSMAMVPSPVSHGVLWLAPRDTVGPRLMAVTYRDTLTVELQLTQSIAPGQSFDAANVRFLMLPDSQPVAIGTLRLKPVDDSLTARAKAVADSTRADSVRRARPDTGRAAAALSPVAPVQPPTRPSAQAPTRGVRPDSTIINLLATRPTLSDRMVLRSSVPLVPEVTYVIEITGVKNLLGVATTSLLGFKVPAKPKPAAVDSTAADSTRRPATPRPGRP